jgi:hypothetical protein
MNQKGNAGLSRRACSQFGKNKRLPAYLPSGAQNSHLHSIDRRYVD